MPYDFDRIIDRRSTESVKWRLYDADVLPMWIADMDLASPEPVIRALHERIEHGVFGYGDLARLGNDLPALREAIVKWLSERYNWQIAPDALVFLPGMVPGINMMCRMVAEPGGRVLVQTPAYPPILDSPRRFDLVCDQMELTRQSDGRYIIDFDRFDQAVTDHTRLFILCNPHNPVGRVFGRDELMRMAETCLRHGALICADEAHADLVFSERRHTPLAALSPEIAARTITLMSPSKTFNLPGLNCAFAIVIDQALRERFRTAIGRLLPNVNILGYTAALAAYREGRPWLDALMQYLEANREVIYDYVNTRLPGVSMGRPEALYLAWLDCRGTGMSDDAPLDFFRDRARVALAGGTTYGGGGGGFARLTFACPRALLMEGLERMRTALENG